MLNIKKLVKPYLPIPLSKWVIFGLILVFYYWLFKNSLDPDFGWHIKAGQHISEFGIPATDIFTYTAKGFKWINHSWLHDLLIYHLYGWGGYNLLAVIFAALWTAALALATRSPYWLATILAGAALIPFLGIRPVVWTVLGFVLLIKLLAAQNQRWWALVPLLFLVWANLHGGFVVGLVVLGFYVLIKKNYKLGAVWMLAALLTLLNPYGAGVYIEVARTVFDNDLHGYIKEWQSWYAPLIAWSYLALLISGYVWFEDSKTKPELWVVGFLGLMSLSAMRHLPLLIVGSLSFSETYIHRFLSSIPKPLKPKPKAVLLCLPVGLLGLSLLGWFEPRLPIFKTPVVNYPVLAVEYLQSHPCPGQIFNYYDYGGYLIWRLPNQPVYIDGRMPSWRDEKGQLYMARHQQILKDPSYRAKEFNRYQIECALVPDNRTTRSFIDSLTSEGWRVKFSHNQTVLLFKQQFSAD